MNRYAIPQEVSSKLVEEDYFVFNPQTCKIHAFSETGSFIWAGLLAGKNPEQILASLLDQYEVDALHARADLDLFCESLHKKGLLEHVN